LAAHAEVAHAEAAAADKFRNGRRPASTERAKKSAAELDAHVAGAAGGVHASKCRVAKWDLGRWDRPIAPVRTFLIACFLEISTASLSARTWLDPLAS
jgi:hypothetical protein